MAPESFFLGPDVGNAEWAKDKWNKIFDEWLSWRRESTSGAPANFDCERRSEVKEERERIELFLTSLQDRFRDEVNTYSPKYMGHMISELSLPALFGHALALLHNPNNASTEVAKAGHLVEMEAINLLLRMVGFDEKEGRGHFTSGGTVANYEAFWRARYRVDHWLSLGCSLVNKGAMDKGTSYFDLAHKGWAFYDKKVKEYELTDQEMKEFSLVIQGPWDLNKKLNSVGMKSFDLSPIILVPRNKHYSWLKSVSIFGLGDSSFWPINLTSEGRMCVEDLERNIEKAKREGRIILMVVSVAGTTEMGVIDPIDKVQDYLDRLKTEQGVYIWHHIDAAYGGYFCSLAGKEESVLSEKSRSSLKAIARSDSVTIDPHKLGYIPYACGAILLPNHKNYSVSSFKAPYLEEDESIKGPYWSTTFEGSRSATGAAATWLSSQSMGLTSLGHGEVLESTIRAKRSFEGKIKSRIHEALIIDPTDTNVSCFSFVKKGEALSFVNKRAEEAFPFFANKSDFSVSKTVLTMEGYSELIKKNLKARSVNIDVDRLVLIRVVLMNPFYMEKGSKYLDMAVDRFEDYLAKIE